MARARAAKPKKQILIREKENPVRVRVGPGLSFTNVDGKVLGNGKHLVDEIVPGPGSKAGWAHLVNGEGWVALDFVEMLER